jgi:hypothetical protein
MAFDLVIDIENSPGALAQAAVAISDAVVNIAAATCIGLAERAELHILVPADRPGVLADLTRKIARAGVNLDLVYVATQNRIVFGAADLAALRAALDDTG